LRVFNCIFLIPWWKEQNDRCDFIIARGCLRIEDANLHVLVWGRRRVIVPFIGIKLIDMVLVTLHMV
jgi:hypothetical protein